MLVTIIVVFALCWAPVTINNVLVAFRVIPELHLGKKIIICVKIFRYAHYNQRTIGPLNAHLTYDP